MSGAEMKMELECTMDEQDVIVLDNGSGCLKVGFSGEDAPRAVIPTITATATVDDAREEEHTTGVDASSVAKKSAAFYGEEALMQPNAVATRPVQRGGIAMGSQQNKDALESLWEHAFRTVLGVDGEELPVLIADAMPLDQNSHASRQWTAEIMFEKLKVSKLAIFNTAVLSLFSTGRTRGLVVESGEGITQAVPVFEGFAIPHAIFKMEVAGQDITANVRSLMEAELGAERTSSLKVMQALKERVCQIAPDYHSAMNGPDTDDEEARSFELPDGTIIKVPKPVRTGAPEVLFGAGDATAPSVQKICYEAVTTCDTDLRHDLVRSIVVAGGTSMLPGLASRFRTELANTLPGELARQVDVCMDSQRRYAAWIGGSMFASLSTFNQVAITKLEYEEGKADVRGLVARKTF